MPPPEQTPDLDPRVASAIDRAVTRLREELMGQLAETRRQIQGMAVSGEPGPGLEPIPPESELETKAPSADLEQLQRGVSRIDRARSQAGILAALLAGTEGFASRAAVFLTRQGESRGWGGVGFGEAQTDLSDLEIDYSAEAPWAELADGLGCVRLSAGECSELCRGIDVPVPKDGVLVPLVLRDQVAAALYADRLTGQDPLEVAALQTLTFCAALAIETLPLRERSLTPTLRMSEAAAPEEQGLGLWGATYPPPAAEAAEEPAAVEAAVSEPVAEAIPEPEILPEAEVTEAEPEWVSAEAFEPLEAEPALEEPPLPVEPEVEEAILEAEPYEAGEVAFEEALDAEEALRVPAEEAAEPPVAAIPEPIEPELQAADEVGFQVEAPEAEIEAPEAAFEVETEEAQELQAPVDPELGAEPDIGAEVAPPEDLAGPGWAFSSTEREPDESEEAAHEEAQRLARLLVTEIKLYNEEQVEQGRKSGDLMKRLEEDIERSRQIYDERVNDEIRGKTDYFRDELVRILADGDPDAL